MSESLEHKHLKKIAMIKLKYMGCYIIYPEAYCGFNFSGVMDAVGIKTNFKNISSIGIEVKISRADFFGSKQKYLAKRKELYKDDKDDLNYKYFLTPKGLVKEEEVYNGWGLLEYNGTQVRKIKEPEKNECDNKKVLISMAGSGHNLYHQNIF